MSKLTIQCCFSNWDPVLSLNVSWRVFLQAGWEEAASKGCGLAALVYWHHRGQTEVMLTGIQAPEKFKCSAHESTSGMTWRICEKSGANVGTHKHTHTQTRTHTACLDASGVLISFHMGSCPSHVLSSFLLLKFRRKISLEPFPVIECSVERTAADTPQQHRRTGTADDGLFVCLSLCFSVFHPAVDGLNDVRGIQCCSAGSTGAKRPYLISGVYKESGAEVWFWKTGKSIFTLQNKIPYANSISCVMYMSITRDECTLWNQVLWFWKVRLRGIWLQSKHKNRWSPMQTAWFGKCCLFNSTKLTEAKEEVRLHGAITKKDQRGRRSGWMVDANITFTLLFLLDALMIPANTKCVEELLAI